MDFIEGRASGAKPGQQIVLYARSGIWWIQPFANQRAFRGSVAVIVSSLGFAFAHFAHGILWPKLLVYSLVGIAFGTTAYLTNSTLPALPHMIGDLTFFTLVWPYDAARRLVLDSGTDNWFWIHVAQAIIFTVLAVLAFQRLARAREQSRRTLGVDQFRLP